MPRVRNVPAPPLSGEIAENQRYVDFLEKNFNEPQLAAIKWAAAHTLRSYEREGTFLFIFVRAIRLTSCFVYRRRGSRGSVSVYDGARPARDW